MDKRDFNPNARSVTVANIESTCGACARVGTNATDVRAHAPGCEHAPPSLVKVRQPISLVRARMIERAAGELVAAVQRVHTYRKATSRSVAVRFTMDRDIALRRLATLVIATLEMANDGAQPTAQEIAAAFDAIEPRAEAATEGGS